MARWQHRDEDISSDEDEDDITEKMESSDSSSGSQTNTPRRALRSHNRPICSATSVSSRVKRSRDH